MCKFVIRTQQVCNCSLMSLCSSKGQSTLYFYNNIRKEAIGLSCNKSGRASAKHSLLQLYYSLTTNYIAPQRKRAEALFQILLTLLIVWTCCLFSLHCCRN